MDKSANLKKGHDLYLHLASYYNRIEKKLANVPGRELHPEDLTLKLKKRANKTYASNFHAFQFVSQVNIDYISFCFSMAGLDSRTNAKFFTYVSLHSDLTLFKHFAEIEKQFHKENGWNYTSKPLPRQVNGKLIDEPAPPCDLKYCLSGESKPILIVHRSYTPKYQCDCFQSGGEIVKYNKMMGNDLTHVYYSVKGGNAGIRKLLNIAIYCFLIFSKV